MIHVAKSINGGFPQETSVLKEWFGQKFKNIIFT